MGLFRKSPVVTSTIIIKNGDLTTINQVTEDDIREEAYRIWEREGRQGDSTEHWMRAKEKIESKIIQNLSSAK